MLESFHGLPIEAVEPELAPKRPGAKQHVPGLLVTALATLSAAYLSDRYGAPLTLMALLIGLALNFLSADARLMPGLAFASRTLLRVAIVLLGARITLGQIADLGPGALGAIAAVMAVTMAAAVLFARWLGFSAAFGTLAGGAVAICGASAAMALSAVLGEKRINQAQLALVLVGISAMSSLAMLLYPIAAHQIGLGDRQAGFMLGASIHDVAQVMGAGYAFSEPAGDTAAIVKLARVSLLAIVLLIVARIFRREPETGLKGFGLPWFVVSFFVLAAVNSTGVVPPLLDDAAKHGSTALLATAVAATGIQAPMRYLLDTGWRPFLVIAASSAVALAASLLFAIVLV
jgi:uncharacterized integral membrane protein (TIGR00698 family)